MFFKRLSRSRSNSQSYVDQYQAPPDATKGLPTSYDDTRYVSGEKYAVAGEPDPVSATTTTGGRPGSSRQSGSAPLPPGEPVAKGSGGMYPRPNEPTEVVSGQYAGSPTSAGGPTRGITNGYGSFDNGAPPSTRQKTEPAPDLLLHAFNQALRPYSDRVDNLESEIADLRAYIDQLERHRDDVHAWIDKRGLRPDVPASIAHHMDTAAASSNPTHAAQTLNAQLDRKITIVNFDLHRLQDDLNDSLPTPSFSACMLKFLPDIARLSALPSGPRYAFDLLLKLGGNLNSHGGLENGDEEDLSERRAFYGRLDEAMVDIVRGRFREEGDGWGVQREIKRIEKTGAYLRNWGVEPYFPHTLDVMRHGGQASVEGPPVASPTYG